MSAYSSFNAQCYPLIKFNCSSFSRCHNRVNPMFDINVLRGTLVRVDYP